MPDLRPNRRRFLALVGASAIASASRVSAQGGSAAMTKEQRDALSPAQILDNLKKGNARFRNGKSTARDYPAQRKATAPGQYPAAIVLECVDSRVPAEILFDAGLGDLFNARIAGNVVNDDMLGSLEFACGVAGAKVIVLLGHTACGAIKGAIDDVVLGNLTGLLARVKPAVAATTYTGERSSHNYAFVDSVARTNVRIALDNIRQRSPMLTDLERKKSIVIVGGMYDLTTGVVEFVEP